MDMELDAATKIIQDWTYMNETQSRRLAQEVLRVAKKALKKQMDEIFGVENEN